MGNYSAGQIGENALQAMEIVAKSVVQQTETSVTRDCVVSEIVDATSGLYTVSTGYSSFAAYSLNQAQYAIGDLVYVQMPAGTGTGDKLILGRRQSGSDAYEFADAFADTVFFNGRDNSLIKLTSPVGLIANGDTTSIHLGTWTGEYAGVTKIGIEGSFNTLLKALGAVEGVYGLKMRTVNNVGNVEEFDFPCSEYYGNPYNYIYSTRVNQLFTYTTQQTLVQIDAYVYQNQDFRDDDEVLIAVAQSANILLNDLYIGVGKLGSEILDSKLSITPYNGSRVYLEGGDATLITTFDTFVDKIGIAELAGKGSEAIWAAINNAQTYDVLNEGLAEDATPVQFTSTQTTRINQWIESAGLVDAINAGTLEIDSMKTQGHNSILVKLSVETPLITFSLVVNTEKTPEYLTATPNFADATNKNEFIRWFKQNRETEINNLTIPSELQSGWELIGGFEKDGTVSEEGYLIFTPDYTKDSETLVALIYYKEKYYVSNELIMINQVDATDKKIDDTKSELIDQAAKDKELIEANQRALNSLVIESGYFETDDSGVIRFKQNNGLYYYYTRSGVIRENDKGRAYGLRCSSTDPNTVIQSLTWEFPEKNTMIRQHEDGYYQEGTLNASGENQIYPRSLITIERKYNPGKTNNIVVVKATCSVTTDGVTRELVLENQIELLFGYYSCEGTEHTLSAYWTNKTTGEVVNCLVPGKTYIAHLILDGKEVVKPTWLDSYGNNAYGDTYTPRSVNEVHLRKGVATLSDDLSLGCWLGAKLSYNEDNIIEGMTQLIYQSDGTTHMRDGVSDADVNPQYRLELLLEDKSTGNQQYADGIYWDPYSGAELSDKEVYDRIKNVEGRKSNADNSEEKASGNLEETKTLVNGFLYDENGDKALLYFSGPSNWSIGVHNLNGSLVDEYFMRDVDGQYETWLNGTLVDCPYFGLVYSPSTDNESALLRSTVDLQMKGVYIETMSDYIFTINIYTYAGYLLARVPLRIDINRYPSIYIDKMAQYNGSVHIDDGLGVIYAPRFLAGKYESPQGTGNKLFTGVALGDFADPETEQSMQLTGIYGFKKGKQAYAFREDGTGFIGSIDSRISFNEDEAMPLIISSNKSKKVFTVSNQGDINLTGSVTGTYGGNGYELNKDGSGYIRHGNYGIYFQPDAYPIYISNSKSNTDKAPFSVDSSGNVNLKGSNVNIDTGNINMTGTGGIKIKNDDKYINIDSKGITLNGNMKFADGSLEGYATDDEIATMQNDLTNLNKAVSNKQIDSAEFEKQLKGIIENSQGLSWNNGDLTLNAANLNGQTINGVNITGSNITAGTLKAFAEGSSLTTWKAPTIILDGSLGVLGSSWVAEFNFGYIGAGCGKGSNGLETYGIALTAGTVKPTTIAPNETTSQQGGYIFVTDGGARIGYFNGSNHTSLSVVDNNVSISHRVDGAKVSHKTLFP